MLKLREDLSIDEFPNLDAQGISSGGSCARGVMDNFMVEQKVEVSNAW
jgi:hypothetical protein